MPLGLRPHPHRAPQRGAKRSPTQASARKSGPHQFAGAAAPLSGSGFACAANSTPQGEGFTLPPPKAAPPHRIPASRKEGGFGLPETACRTRIEAPRAPISRAAGVAPRPGPPKALAEACAGRWFGACFRPGYEVPIGLARWAALPGQLLRASCPVPWTGLRSMRLWWRRSMACLGPRTTSFGRGGPPRSARSSRRPAARPGRMGGSASEPRFICCMGTVLMV